MTYQEWLEEMNKGRGTELQKSKRLIKNAAARCSMQTREALEALLNDLDELFAAPAGEPEFEDYSDLFFERQDPEDLAPVSESGYGFLSADLGNEFVAMMNRYEPPLELLEQQGVPNAFFEIFNALGILDRAFPVTDFTKTWEREDAAKKDAETFAAQIMAMKDMKEEASLKEFLEAAVGISIWKGKSAFRGVMKDPGLRLRLIQDESFDDFRRDMQPSLDKYEADHARTFKELSGELAQIYRKDQKYADLELRMNALRAVAGEKEKDRAKWDDVRITVTEFTNKVRELQAAENGNLRPDEYQNELADCWESDSDLKAKAIHNIYNPTPVFMDEFNDNNALMPCYRRQDFDKNMKNIEISEFSFGEKPLTEDEFGSLSFLAVIDPQLTGCFMAVGNNTVPVDDPDLDLVSANLVPAVISYGDQTEIINGQKVFGPDNRVANTMEVCVAPAREKVRKALQAWESGKPEALGAILAKGLNYFVNDMEHNLSPDRKYLNSDQVAYSNLTKGAIDLLRRDKKLMEAAKNAGLKENTFAELEGICMASRVEKAAREAKKRITEGAGGLRRMSAFEKQQCVIAVQRYDALLNDIKETEELSQESNEYKEIESKFEKKIEELFKKNPNYSSDPVLSLEAKRATYKYKYDQAKAMQNSKAFLALAKDGLAGMDSMLPQDRLDPKEAASMSSIELAQKLGLAEQREFKTTAKEVYDTLTNDYKAHRINYALYEARLKVMREITGGNKNARIDIKALDDAIEMRLQKNLGPLETAINDITREEFSGELGSRLKHIYSIYGKKPEKKLDAITNRGYTEEQFNELKTYKEGYLHIGNVNLDQFEFAALAVAATQADPKLGGVYLVKNDRTGNGEGEYVNFVENPTVDDAAALRSFYVTDIDMGTGLPRENTGAYFSSTIEPARKKVDDALKAYDNGKGSCEELGKIIGLGMKNIITHSMIVNKDSAKWVNDAVIEGHILGKLTYLAGKNPKLYDEVQKHISPDQFKQAKGMAAVYDIVRSSAAAREKLQKAEDNGTKLSDIERRACIELMLRGKALLDNGIEHSKTKYTKKVEDEIAAFNEAHPPKTDRIENSKEEPFLTAQMQCIEYKNVGLPDYVKKLGELGPLFARDLLDKMMPSREAFMKLSNEEILKQTAIRHGADGDPFMNKEYTKSVYNEEHRLDESLREFKVREAAPQQRTL